MEYFFFSNTHQNFVRLSQQSGDRAEKKEVISKLSAIYVFRKNMLWYVSGHILSREPNSFSRGKPWAIFNVKSVEAIVIIILQIFFATLGIFWKLESIARMILNFSWDIFIHVSFCPISFPTEISGVLIKSGKNPILTEAPVLIWSHLIGTRQFRRWPKMRKDVKS